MRTLLIGCVFAFNTHAAMAALVTESESTPPSSIILENDTDYPWTAIHITPDPPMIERQWTEVGMEAEAIPMGKKISISFDGKECLNDVLVFFFTGAALVVSVDFCQAGEHKITGTLK